MLTPEANRHARTTSPLLATLAAALPALHQSCRDPWVVVGSAAAWLVGADVAAADLDLLTSVRDAHALGERWHAHLEDRYVPEGSDRFRSHFARFAFPGVPVEVMGELEVHGDSGWVPVQVNQIITVHCAGVAVPVPSVAEQIRILELFGRSKDLQRVSLLESLSRNEKC